MTPLSNDTSDYILSIIAAKDDAQHAKVIAEVEGWLKGHKIQLETRKRTAFVATATIQIEPAQFQRLLSSLIDRRSTWLDSYGCNVNICSAALSRWWHSTSDERCLFLFDLDSTLIKMETIDEMARLAGVYDQVSVH